MKNIVNEIQAMRTPQSAQNKKYARFIGNILNSRSDLIVSVTFENQKNAMLNSRHES